LILLLHGQPGSGRDWEQVQRALGPGVRTTAIDRPGWDGRSSPTDLAGNAMAALATLDSEQVPRATVVGHSLGAAVAAWLAIERPERVAALVLAAPSVTCASLNRLDRILATPVLGALIAGGAMAGAGSALRTPRLRRRIAGALGLEEAYLQKAGGTLLHPNSWRTFVTEQRMLFRELPRLERRLSEISPPTTIVTGTADRIVSSASASRLAAEIPRAGLIRLPGATHLLPQQRPVELAEIILDASRRA